jgi:hypothetical protein
MIASSNSFINVVVTNDKTFKASYWQ